ncbi:MAG: molybdate ABC transporter substrate-binding protein [Candidatus Nanopelagicales bacterium]
MKTVFVGPIVALCTLGCALMPLAPASAQSDQPTGTITVSAAASLTDVFPAIARAFTKRYPGTKVQFNFAGSSTLVEQVLAGAPVDVLATASEPTMWKAVQAGAAEQPLHFAKNTMMVVTPADNPAHIAKFSDLSRPGVLVAVCAIAVPCGSAARDLFAKNAITVKPVTQELDVRSVLSKVVAGEVDAGIVYVTDARSAGSEVTALAVPPAINVTTTYPIAAVKDSSNPFTARAFVQYVRFTTSAQGLLRAYGFSKPW